MIANMPPCTHPPVPAYVAPLGTLPGKDARRPYATIIMTVDANGHVVKTRIDNSSGDKQWDAQAAASARAWTFVPAAEDCKAISGVAEYAVGTGPAITFPDPCDHDAEVHGRVTPTFKKSSLAEHLDGTTIVQVMLDEAARVKSASFVQSSGTVVQDRAAYAAALTSTYVPAVRACAPIDGGYWFKVVYTRDKTP